MSEIPKHQDIQERLDERRYLNVPLGYCATHLLVIEICDPAEAGWKYVGD